mgnify:CR=1 FL=1
MFENRGWLRMKTYSEEYSSTYNDMLNGMIERRLTKSIITVGSYWYTAWVNAGQPNLNELLEKQPSEVTIFIPVVVVCQLARRHVSVLALQIQRHWVDLVRDGELPFCPQQVLTWMIGQLATTQCWNTCGCAQMGSLSLSRLML